MYYTDTMTSIASFFAAVLLSVTSLFTQTEVYQAEKPQASVSKKEDTQSMVVQDTPHVISSASTSSATSTIVNINLQVESTSTLAKAISTKVKSVPDIVSVTKKVQATSSVTPSTKKTQVVKPSTTTVKQVSLQESKTVVVQKNSSSTSGISSDQVSPVVNSSASGQNIIQGNSSDPSQESQSALESKSSNSLDLNFTPTDEQIMSCEDKDEFEACTYEDKDNLIKSGTCFVKNEFFTCFP
jgi:hypothetical protein